MIVKFQRGETIPVWVEVQDWDDAYVDPTAVKVTIIDSKGVVKVNAAAMTKDAIGKYVYYYNSVATDETGWWRASADIIDGVGAGAKVTITPGGFNLE